MSSGERTNPTTALRRAALTAAAALLAMLLPAAAGAYAAAASQKLASGGQTWIAEANVRQEQELKPVSQWGHDYMHARYYSDTLGRFVSVDPVGGKGGNSQSWNRYSYAQNNPLKLIDPDGEQAVGVFPSPVGPVPVPLPVVVPPQTGAPNPPNPLDLFNALADQARMVGITVYALARLQFEYVYGNLFSEATPDPSEATGEESTPTAPDLPGSADESPGEEWEWRGKPNSKPGDKDGNWYNPKTGESLRPDLDHPEPVRPHWDYRDPGGKWWRVYPDGKVVPK